MLNQYIQDIEVLLHDANLQFYGSPLNLTNIINRARKFVSAEGQCVRVLLPKSSVSTVANQEKYLFSSFASSVTANPGVNSIQAILSVAVSRGTTTPVLEQVPWYQMQAIGRAYSSSYTGYPAQWAQYGYGSSGSFYLWPVPSDAYGMDIDAYCLPNDLATDADVEAIPYPWTEAVQYYAAHICLLNAKLIEEAKMMLGEYRRMLEFARATTQGPFIPSAYVEG